MWWLCLTNNEKWLTIIWFYNIIYNVIHLLHIGHSKMSLDQLLDQQPTIQEITTHARTEK